MSDFAPTDTLLSIKNYITGFPEVHITEEDYKKYDGSFAVMRFGRGPASTIALAYIKDGVYEWRSSDGVKIYTQNGVIIKTDGLAHDMELDSTCFEKKIIHLSKQQSCKMSLYNPDLLQAYSLFTITDKQFSSVLRFEKKIPVSQLKATIEIPSIKWSKENIYYLDKGLVLSSIEHIHPRLAPVHIEYFLAY